jgi:hypothetical protein
MVPWYESPVARVDAEPQMVTEEEHRARHRCDERLVLGVPDGHKDGPWRLSFAANGNGP